MHGALGVALIFGFSVGSILMDACKYIKCKSAYHHEFKQCKPHAMPLNSYTRVRAECVGLASDTYCVSIFNVQLLEVQYTNSKRTTYMLDPFKVHQCVLGM